MEATEFLGFIFFFLFFSFASFLNRMKHFDRFSRDTGIGDQQLQTVHGAKFPFAIGLFNYRF